MSTACCSLLTQYVNTVIAAWESGRDLTEAVKTLVVVNGLAGGQLGNRDMSSDQIDTLCTSVNSYLTSIGSTESVSAPRVKAEVASSSSPIQDGNPYCDIGADSTTSQGVLNTLNKAAGDICFFGCFAAALYQSALQRYGDVTEDLKDAGTSFAALLAQMAQAPERWGEVGLNQIESLGNIVSDIVNNIGAIGESFQGMNFSEILWAFVKSYGARYANHIMLGAAQGLVNQLALELDGRAAKYSILDQKLVTVMEAVENLVGYDWWDEFVAAVTRAKSDVSRADASLSRAEVGMNTGNWDRENISMAQARLMLAKSGISSVDMIGATVKELTEAFSSGDPFAFRWNAGRSVRQDFLEDLEALGFVLDEVRQLVTCLTLQSKRVEILVQLISSLSGVIGNFEGFITPSASLDVQIESDIISGTRENLASIHSEMTAVLANEDRIAAPGYLTSWHAALSVLISGLEVMNIYPSTAYLNPDPLGIVGYTTDAVAVTKLNAVVTATSSMATPSAITFAETIVRTGGDWGRLMANRRSWEQRMSEVRSELRNSSAKDGAVAGTCRGFSGYDNEYYNYIIDTLDDMGWRGAKQSLERGNIMQFLSMSLNIGVAFSVAVDCIASLIDASPADAGIALALGEEYSKLEAESVVSIRAPAMLPAFQFEIIMSLTEKIKSITSTIERVMAIQEGVC